MLRVTTSWLIDAISSVDGVQNLREGQKVSSAWSVLFNARTGLDSIYSDSVYAPHLKISSDHASTLRRAIQAVIDMDGDAVIGIFEAMNISRVYSNFKAVASAELARLPTYLVVPKDNYDTDRLIDNGAGLFPSDMILKVPGTRMDAMQCGKCLAFEVYTACGFHTFRLLEAVLRRYWSSVAPERVLPKPATLGNIGRQLQINSLGEEAVWEALIQLANLHRNPLTHAEVILDRDEAIALVGMSRSVITPMLRVIPEAPLTTLSPDIAV